MIKLKKLLRESPDDFHIKISGKSIYIDFEEGICTFLIYSEMNGPIQITGLGYNDKEKIVISNNDELREKINKIVNSSDINSDEYEYISDFYGFPSHSNLKELIRRINYSHDTRLKYHVDGRIFEYDSKYYLTSWQNIKLVRVFKKQIEVLLSQLNIKEEDLSIESYNDDTDEVDFIPYNEFMGINSNIDDKQSEKHEKKMRDLRIAHERKALLNKELKDFLDDTPKTNIELFKQLEKKFGVPVAKLRTLKNKPLDVLLKKKVKELIQEMKLNELPFLEEQISDNEYIRTFDQNVDENELKWHIDGENRIVESLHPTDWMLQLDNELPKKIEGKIQIKEGQYHRIIRGNGELKLKIVKC